MPKQGLLNHSPFFLLSYFAKILEQLRNFLVDIDGNLPCALSSLSSHLLILPQIFIP